MKARVLPGGVERAGAENRIRGEATNELHYGLASSERVRAGAAADENQLQQAQQRGLLADEAEQHLSAIDHSSVRV